VIMTDHYLKITVQHNCVNCGKVRRADVSAGKAERQTTCMACNTTYVVTRAMHVPGLINKQ